MQQFIETHGLDAPTGALVVPTLPPTAPQGLVSLMERVGGRHCARGFWSFRRTSALSPYLATWGLVPDQCMPFLRSAFGHIVFLQGPDCRVLNPVFNTVDDLGLAADLGFVMDLLLCDRPALEASFLIDLYESSVERLGIPGDDEIYALVPALRMGGSREASQLQRRPMAAEMQLLAQI